MDSIQTIIENASLDLKTIENFVNLPEGSDVRPRLLPSVDVGTLAGIRQAIFETGGLPATPFATKAAMSSSALLDNTYAMVTDDTTTANNGLYQKKAGVWVKSSYDPLTQAKSYTDTAKSSAISTAAGDATTKANTAKSEAISASATDATTKANTAKTEAIAAAATDATSKANAAEANAKTYADTNKLDYKDVTNGYVNGNMIGENSERHVGFGLSPTGVPQIRDYFDSVILRVFSGDSIYLHYGSSSSFAAGADFGFYSDNPYENQSQTSLSAVVSDYIVNPDNGIWYKVATVPTTAKYLMINTRYDRTTLVSFNWGVGRDSFVLSTKSGEEKVVAISGKRIDVSLAVSNASTYTDNKLLSYEKTTTSTKNLFDNRYIKNLKINKNGLFFGVGNDITTRPIAVEQGAWYTVSGLPQSMYASIGLYVAALSSDITTGDIATPTTDLSMNLGVISHTTVGLSGGAFKFYINNPAVKFIVIPLSASNGQVNGEDAVKNLALQVERGEVATRYEPYSSAPSLKRVSNELYKYIDSKQKKALIPPFTELNKARETTVVAAPFIKNISPMGIYYSQKAGNGITSNNLYTKVEGFVEGKKTIYAHLMKYLGGTATMPSLKSTPFTVPSGQYDNPNTLSDHNRRNSKFGYVHPDIAYSSTAIGGFKYWMVASILPPTNDGIATWEDEDLFVSNDAKNWQRVRSMYETDKTYTTTTLRLPPQSLETESARKHAFLPVPPKGATIEMSMPADNGAAAVDRQMITLNGTATPFKHDPAILIDGGFVYVYHSFHLAYAERDGGSSRFLVCTRTNNGIDWDIVRTDGSTMRLTEETSRQIFTKDAQGRYNYIYYAYSRGYSNPTIVKYGTNDYEFIYGYNYSRRYKGTTPYNFDFSTEYPLQDMGNFNHPMIFYAAGKTYLINHNSIFESTNRGANFTKLPHYPCWIGGVDGIGYKKSVCIGEGGKLILADVQRYSQQYSDSIASTNFSSTMRENLLFLYEYPSVSDFISKATNGLVDAYIDVQLCKVNTEKGKRDFVVVPARGLDSITNNVNSPLQRVAIADMEFAEGDELYIFVTLTARNGAEIQFGGIDIM